MAYTRSKKYPELYKPGTGAIWWAFLPNPEKGPKLRESTTHSDERVAHLWYLSRITEDPRGTSRTQQAKKERTLALALAMRIEWLEAALLNEDDTRKRLALSTIKFYKAHGKPLVRILGADTKLSSIDHEMIRRYIVQRSKEVKGGTISKDLITLSCAMRLARKDGVKCSRFDEIVPEDFKALYAPRERWLTELEVDALLSVLAPQRAAVVAFIVATGATYPSEVAPVRKDDVDKYVVHIKGTKRKTRNRRLKVPSHARKYLDYAMKHIGAWGFEKWVNIVKDLKKAAALLSMCPKCRGDSRIRVNSLGGARFKAPTPVACAACEAVPEFAPLCPTDLRRTFCQWLVRSGVPYELVYPMMGHDSPAMLERVYGRRDASSVADLVELALAKAPKGARGRKAG